MFGFFENRRRIVGTGSERLTETNTLNHFYQKNKVFVVKLRNATSWQ